MLDLIAPQLESMTAEEFFHFCQQNKHLRIERDEHQQILFMPPERVETANKYMTIGAMLTVWNMQHQLGKTFGTSAGFTLPDGSMRSPEPAWISNKKCSALSDMEK